jgi:MFS family permease
LVAVLFVVWGLTWGLVPLALQTLMLTTTPDAPEASAAVLMSVLQLAIALGSAVGGLLVDSAGLEALFVAAGITAIAAALIATVGRHGTYAGDRPGNDPCIASILAIASKWIQRSTRSKRQVAMRRRERRPSSSMPGATSR